MYEENFYHLNEDTEVLNEIGIRKKIGALIGRYKEKLSANMSPESKRFHKTQSVESVRKMLDDLKSMGASVKGSMPQFNKEKRYNNMPWRVHDPEVIKKHLGKNWERVKNHVKKHVWALTHRSKN